MTGSCACGIRAYRREQAWAPRQVTNELAGTIQARDHHCGLVTRLAAQDHTTTDPQDRLRLEREAHQASALADTLDAHVD